jgi:hypothetical protein
VTEAPAPSVADIRSPRDEAVALLRMTELLGIEAPREYLIEYVRVADAILGTVQ